MKKFLRAFLRALLLSMLLLAGALSGFGLLMIKPKWPSRREDSVVEILPADAAPESPAPNLEVRAS